GGPDARLSGRRRRIASDPAQDDRRCDDAPRLARHAARSIARRTRPDALRAGSEAAAQSVAGYFGARAGRPLASGMDTNEVRRTAGAAMVDETRPGSAARERRGRAEQGRCAVEGIPAATAVQAHRRAAARAGRNPSRPATAVSDAAPAA